MDDKPIAAGMSSFDMIDPQALFSELNITKGLRLLDLACGNGRYSIFASPYVGKQGLIYAVDLWDEGIKELEQEIKNSSINNIKAIITDVSANIPIDSESIDICLMATVLHDLVHDKTDAGTLDEVTRVIRSNGVLAILEFKKLSPPPGPPLEIRLSTEQIDSLVIPSGFAKIKNVELGEYAYLSIYHKKDGI